MKEEGKASDLLERIATDPAIGLTATQIRQHMHVKLFIGRATEQTHEFLSEHVSPVLKKHNDISAYQSQIHL
jgi:adenylosuccinate lyase